MGVFDFFNSFSRTPSIQSVLPDVAKQQIMSGTLPKLKPSNLFLKRTETCHYADRAIYEKRIVGKQRVRKNNGYSVPGLFKGTRIHVGRGNTETFDTVKYENIKGILYVTDRRIIFVGGHEGFDRKIDELIAITPYTNCIEFQFSKETYKIFVPDGSIIHQVLRLLQ